MSCDYTQDKVRVALLRSTELLRVLQGRLAKGEYWPHEEFEVKVTEQIEENRKVLRGETSGKKSE